MESFSYQVTWIEGLEPCPKWLGNFQLRLFGQAHGRNHGRLPYFLKQLAVRMEGLVPKQRFTTASLQKYEVGQAVKPHRDPKSNTGYTVISVFGDFEGAQIVVEKRRLTLNPGDVLIQRCAIGNLRRPLHRMSPVTSGTRYSLIISTTTN